jgi:hypothetical protein
VIWRRRREPDPGDLVKIASAGNQAVAEMWREVLANEGIPALARIAGPLTAYATFASPHDLLVAAGDAERAREILAAYNEEEGGGLSVLDEDRPDEETE